MDINKETLEMIIDVAEMKGFYEEQAAQAETVIRALLDNAKIDYTGKRLEISSDLFTTILSVYDSDLVKTIIEAKSGEKKEAIS